jgi:hypothetical protein
MRPTYAYGTSGWDRRAVDVPSHKVYMVYDPGGGKIAPAPNPLNAEPAAPPPPDVVKWMPINQWWYRQGDEENGSGI